MAQIVNLSLEGVAADAGFCWFNLEFAQTGEGFITIDLLL